MTVQNHIQTPSTQTAIRCKSTGRLSFRADAQGIWVFCRQHNTQHLMTWGELEVLKLQIQADTVSGVVYI